MGPCPGLCPQTPGFIALRFPGRHKKTAPIRVCHPQNSHTARVAFQLSPVQCVNKSITSINKMLLGCLHGLFDTLYLEIATHYEFNPNQLSRWKKEAARALLKFPGTSWSFSTNPPGHPVEQYMRRFYGQVQLNEVDQWIVHTQLTPIFSKK